ncbi:hypothetical protein C8F04DRAFT_1235677 [Mycena alexandri]|uniref:Uncharacterized protein n=1 Tax=Mycena alexandri TaxID=1745969 RepID=A0AAD6SRF5_9AGAR|nr:hypothetical protein C8F04DRAFT_1235677 [Mycena alexandri]
MSLFNTIESPDHFCKFGCTGDGGAELAVCGGGGIDQSDQILDAVTGADAENAPVMRGADISVQGGGVLPNMVRSNFDPPGRERVMCRGFIRRIRRIRRMESLRIWPVVKDFAYIVQDVGQSLGSKTLARKEQSTDNRGLKKLTPEAMILHTETGINVKIKNEDDARVLTPIPRRSPMLGLHPGEPAAELEPHPAAPPSPVRHIREDLLLMGGTLPRTGERRDVVWCRAFEGARGKTKPSGGGYCPQFALNCKTCSAYLCVFYSLSLGVRFLGILNSSEFMLV